MEGYYKLKDHAKETVDEHVIIRVRDSDVVCLEVSNSRGWQLGEEVPEDDLEPSCWEKISYDIEADNTTTQKDNTTGHSQAMRYNTGKPELSYILDVMPALKDMVAVLEFGAKKYERNNWQRGFPKDKLLDSLLRHIDAFYSGEDVDPESGLPHVGHILCNAAFLGYHYGSNSEYWEKKYGQQSKGEDNV